MRRADRIAAALALALLGTPAPAANWHRLIIQHDQQRLKNWRRSWTEALDQARAAGFGGQVDREGALLQPDAAMEAPRPPDGTYRCRILKLGRPTLPTPDPSPVFRTLPEAPCRIEGTSFATLAGAQRPTGTLFPDTDLRVAFLGGMALGDEAGVSRYGRDEQRSLAGFVERFAPGRWRLVVPQPAWEARLMVIELVPAGS